jgi:hypothetical protein
MPATTDETEPDSIRAHVQRMNAIARMQVTELRHLTGDALAARARLMQHTEKMTLESDGGAFDVSGDRNL